MAEKQAFLKILGFSKMALRFFVFSALLGLFNTYSRAQVASCFYCKKRGYSIYFCRFIEKDNILLRDQDISRTDDLIKLRIGK